MDCYHVTRGNFEWKKVDIN